MYNTKNKHGLSDIMHVENSFMIVNIYVYAGVAKDRLTLEYLSVDGNFQLSFEEY